MTSQVTICNQALALVGGNLITALTDASTEAKLCNLNYAAMRDSVLEAHNWTFATKWLTLPAASDPPPGLYANFFPLPSDVLTVLFVGQPGAAQSRWQIEGEGIVTDESTCQCQCIMRVEDPSKFSPTFTQALVQRLAAELAIPLTESRTLYETHMTVYQQKVQRAATRDNQQGRTKRLRSSWLVNARYRDGGPWDGPWAGPYV